MSLTARILLLLVGLLPLWGCLAQKPSDKFWVAKLDLWNPPFHYWLVRPPLHFPPHWCAELERSPLGSRRLSLTCGLEVNAKLEPHVDPWFFVPVGARAYLPPRWKSQRSAEGFFVGAQVAPFWLHLSPRAFYLPYDYQRNRVGMDVRLNLGFQKHVQRWSFAAYGSVMRSILGPEIYSTRPVHLRGYLTVGRILKKTN